jgi:hypothetical protein
VFLCAYEPVLIHQANLLSSATSVRQRRNNLHRQEGSLTNEELEDVIREIRQ